MRNIAANIKARYFAEVGTARGLQSITWAKYLFDLGMAGEVFTCDITSHDDMHYITPLTGEGRVSRRMLWSDVVETSLIRFVHGDSSVLSHHINQKIDMMYIDGKHDYDSVINDYTNLIPHLRNRGILVFDDCDERFPGVRNAVEEIADDLNARLDIVTFEPNKYRVAILEANFLNSHKHTKFLLQDTAQIQEIEKTESEIFGAASDIYLASADKMSLVLENCEVLKSSYQQGAEHYATVIGGLSGLNYMAQLCPKNIHFFDINPYMIDYVKLVLNLISISDTPEEFISRVFCRNVQEFENNNQKKLSLSTQMQYLAQEPDPQILQSTRELLADENRTFYDAWVTPHHAGKTLEGKLNCRQLLPCWPIDKKVPVGAGIGLGFDSHDRLVPNVNTFFYGYGWLQTQEYIKTKTILEQATMQYHLLNILDANMDFLFSPHNAFVLHVSNIDDWFKEKYIDFKMRIGAVARNFQSDLLVITSHNGIEHVNKDPHSTAYEAILPRISGKLVEVVTKPGWGFNEIDRVAQTVDEYIKAPVKADTVLLHILIGEGMSFSVFKQVLSTAMKTSKKVLILEHNRDSKDWNNSTVQMLNSQELFDLCTLHAKKFSFSASDIISITGIRDGQRNVLLTLDCLDEERG